MERPPHPSNGLLIRNVRPYGAHLASNELQSVLIDDRFVIAVGPAAELAGRRAIARTIDGAGATLLPGFIDSHFHLLEGALESSALWFRDLSHRDALRGEVAQYLCTHPATQFVIVRGLGHELFKDLPLPVRSFLDGVVADRPLLCMSFDDHMGWANTAALSVSGILYGAQTLTGSTVVLDDSGKATGELREPGAYRLVLDSAPKPNDAQRALLLQTAMRSMARAGITSVHNMNGDPQELAVYLDFERRGVLLQRIHCPLSLRSGDSRIDLSLALAMRSQCHGDMVRSNSVKMFLDGVIEQGTAFMLDPYSDGTSSRGAPNYSYQEFSSLARSIHAEGMQILVHSIGDAATRMALDILASLHRIDARDARHRIEHLEVVHPEDIKRFAEFGIIASLQPLHWHMAMHDADWQKKVGVSRMRTIYPWRELGEMGARVVFGSDWNVAPFDPLAALTVALERSGAESSAARTVELNKLLRHYTVDAAYAEFQESVKGSIAPGFFADLCLLDGDLLEGSEDPAKFRPVLTICGGAITHDCL